MRQHSQVGVTWRSCRVWGLGLVSAACHCNTWSKRGGVGGQEERGKEKGGSQGEGD
jgi:hypothetical protein